MPEEYDLGKLVASIALDIDEMKQDVKDAKSKLNELGSAEKQLTEDTKKASDGFTVMKGVLSDLVSAGIKKASEAFINLAKDIVQTGQQFSASMSEVQAISGATGSELEKLEQTAREFGATTKFSATEAADALKYMALAGWDAETSMAALPGVLDLAAASGMNLAAASDMVTDYLSAFGMEAEEASYMADLLTYAQGNSNTSAQQLGEAWKNCAANLNAAGQDVETVTSLLEAMANQGLKGSEAGTAVTAMMRDLTNKMDDGKITIGETSVTVQDAEGNFRDLTAILANVEQAVDGMGTAQRAAALSGTFTEESLKGLNLVLNEGVSNVSTYEEALRNSTGAAADAASTMSDNLSGDLKTMESAFEELKLKIFEDAEGPLRDIVQMVTRDGVPAIEALINNIDKLIPVVVTAAAAMGSYKAAVAVQSIVKGAQQGIDDLKETIAKKTAATKAATAAEKLDTAEEQANKAAKQASTVEEQANTIAKNNNAVATKTGTTEEQLNAAATNTAKVAKDSEKIATEGATVAQEGLNKSMEANPVGLLVSALSILITVLSSAAIAIWGNAEEVSEHTKAMIEASSAADKYTGALEDLKSREDEVGAEVAGETALLKEQQAEYDELRNKAELTEEEKKRLAAVAGQLAETLGLTTQDLKTQEGAYKDLSKEIDTYIDKMMQAARAEYYADLIKESARTAESLKKPLKEAKEELENYKAANSDLVRVMQATGGKDGYGYTAQQYQDYLDRVHELNAAVGTLKEKYNTANEEMEEAADEYEKLAGETDNLGKKTTETASDTDTLTKSTTDAASAAEVYKKKLKEAETELLSNTEAQKAQRDTVNKLRKEVDEMADAVAGLTENEKGYTEQDLYEKQQEYLKAQEGLAELNTEETYLRDNIRSIKDAIKDTGDTGISYLDALSNAAKNLRGSLSDLAGSYEKLNGGQTLSYTTLLDLVDKYPEYATQLANAAGNADLQKAAIEALFNAKKQDYILTQQAAIDNIKASKKEAEETIKCIKAVIEAIGVKDGIFTTMYSSMLQNLINDVAGYDSELGTLQAKIDLMNGIDINSFSGSGGTSSSSPVSSGGSGSSGTSRGATGSDGRTKYTTTVGYSYKGESYNASYDFYEGDDTSTLEADTRAKALLGLLDRVKSMGKVTAQEEISYLNDVLKTANLSADQQYEIRQRLYNAQKSFAESEKKAQGDALKAEYDRIEKSKNRGEISTKEEIEQLENIKKKFALTTEQKIALEEKLYDKRKQLREEEQKAQEEAIKAEYARIEKSRSRGEISTKQEIEQLEKIYKKYKLTTEQKAELDDKLYEKRKQLQEENLKAEYEQIEKKKSRNEISTKEEIAQLEKIYRKYKLTTEQKEELDEKLYEKRQQLRSEEISALDKLGDAVVTALKSKYAQQKELEEKRLDESVESWQKWEDETVSSIQGQIDALDELKEAHEEENKREEYENKRQALELELRYEKDDYNRKQIQKEIAALDKEENERLFSVQIEERKKALQEQQEEAKELSKAKQEEIQNTKAEMSARYDELMTDFALQGEAKKFILESSQDEITQLINSYASDYEMLGTTLGESLYNGISKKVGDIVEYVDDIAKKTDTQAERDKAAKALEKYVSSGAAQGSVKEPAVIPAANKVISFADSFSDILRRISESASLYKQQMSSVADSSAMHFYQTQRNYSTNSSTNSTRNSKTINVNTTVNFQRQVDSPAQMKRRLEGILVDVAKQM